MVPVNGVNWNLRIPDVFLAGIGIRDESLTLGRLLGRFQALRDASAADQDSYRREMEKSTDFNKELVASEISYKSLLREEQRKTKNLSDELTRSREMNTALLDEVETRKAEKKVEPQEISALKKELASSREEVTKRISSNRDLQYKLVKAKEGYESLLGILKKEASGFDFSFQESGTFDSEALFCFLRDSMKRLQDEANEAGSLKMEIDKQSSLRTDLEHVCVQMEAVITTSRKGLKQLEGLWAPCLGILSQDLRTGTDEVLKSLRSVSDASQEVVRASLAAITETPDDEKAEGKKVNPPPLRSKPAPAELPPKGDSSAPTASKPKKAVVTIDLDSGGEDTEKRISVVSSQAGKGSTKSSKGKTSPKSPGKTPRKRAAPTSGTSPKPRKKQTRASKKKSKVHDSPDEYDEGE